MGQDMIRSVREVLKEDYVIPLYQRNYNWGITEIRQLLQDIYESYVINPKKNYYIGSLVVFSRKGQIQIEEVIDGQQRLTTVHLMARLIEKDFTEFANLRYDSRPEVETFFQRLTDERRDIIQRDEDKQQSNLTNYFGAVHTILYEKLESEVGSTISIDSLSTEQLKNFSKFFFTKVTLVKVVMPGDTDVASYFEIMNNRGRQLQEHEILKAFLMAKIDQPKDRRIFGNVWDACSQMDRPIQKFFKTEHRALLFGDYYDKVYPKRIKQLTYGYGKSDRLSILEILDLSKDKRSTAVLNEENESETDEELEYTSVIDFSNFLIHLLKLSYPDANVPLSSDKLLSIYNQIPSRIISSLTPMDFLEKLFFYRVVFDRFLVKSEVDSENADQFGDTDNQNIGIASRGRWMLLKPVMYSKNTKRSGKKIPSLYFKNSFDNSDYQQRAIKLLSMLQVTYRQRKNKNFLQHILGLFDPEKPQTIEIEAGEFVRKVESFVLVQFDKLELDEYYPNDCISSSGMYAEGTNTPHFVFNMIDYLLWIEQAWNGEMLGIDEDFDFTYRNSVEHHFPQAQQHMLHNNENNKKLLHCLGNLCLISKGSNSKLNDRSAWDKATDPRYSGGVLSPKRKIMYQLTRESKQWNDDEILTHYQQTIKLLQKRREILNANHE